MDHDEQRQIRQPARSRSHGLLNRPGLYGVLAWMRRLA
jgi:hypothetical protein